MKTRIGIQMLKAFVLAGGILGVIVASPILDAVNKEASPGANAKESGVGARTEQVMLSVQGMKNEFDPDKIKNELRQTPGVLSTECNQKAGTCRVEIASTQIKKEDLVSLINRIGYRASLQAGQPTP